MTSQVMKIDNAELNTFFKLLESFLQQAICQQKVLIFLILSSTTKSPMLLMCFKSMFLFHSWSWQSLRIWVKQGRPWRVFIYTVWCTKRRRHKGMYVAKEYFLYVPNVRRIRKLDRMSNMSHLLFSTGLDFPSNVLQFAENLIKSSLTDLKLWVFEGE